jgi:hypothetical protein
VTDELIEPQEWVSRALIDWSLKKPTLTYARMYDSDYDSVANFDDPAWIERIHGISPAGLPMRGDRIDTSHNPGRRVLRRGGNSYIEAVAAEMWLGPEFWARTGADRAAVMAAASWLAKLEVLTGDVVYVQAQDKPFTTGVGHEDEFQDRLRALLFPASI